MNLYAIRWGTLALLFLTLLAPGHAASQQFKDTYPRIGAYEISGSFRVTDPEYRETLAKNDILILGMWRRWSQIDDVSGERLDIRDVVVDIRRRAELMGNPNIRIAKYTAINESNSKSDNDATRERWEKLHSEVGPGLPVNNDWWARTKDGEHTSSFPGQWHVNMTEHVQRDEFGDTYPEWTVKTDYEVYFKDIPEFDMWFVDNWFYRPRVEPDWDGDGKNDDRNSPSVRRDFRQGYINALNRIRELAPDRVVMGNVDGEVTTNSGMLTETEFRGKMTALFEGAIGLEHSPEDWGGWERMMDQYRITARNAQNNVVLITVHGDAKDYATMRYGLASCLMDDGYFYYTSHDEKYKSGLWYDEYDVDLGWAIDPPQSSPWKQGVYMRRFEKGMALVNPKGNGRQTISIPTGYKRIQGIQDSQTNNGQIAETVTLSERDGLILVGVDQNTEIKRPKPPEFN